MWKPNVLGAAIAALFVSSVIAASAHAKPPMWIVRDGDSEVVLFGSVHVLPRGLDWEPAPLKAAIANADDIWFELPIDPSTDAEVSQLASYRGVLPQGGSLVSLLSPKGRERLNKACARFHLSVGLIDRFEPWFAEVALAGAEYREAGASSDAGVENTLSGQAGDKVQRRAFETAEQQIDMFDTAPLDAQLASLEETLAELDRGEGAYGGLIEAWMSADIRALDEQALGPLRKAAPEIYVRLVSDRNAAWTRALDARLKGHGKSVVVVGVGHLIGEGGVPARLRALGYSVEGP